MREGDDLVSNAVDHKHGGLDEGQPVVVVEDVS